MKFCSSVLFVVLTARAAAADSVALDYKADDATCIDASRFADEVSAKLGFVPWVANASGTIRIRVTREGDGFTGTVKNVDGTAKIIDGKTCAEVTANLAVTVAAVVDRTPEPPAVAAAPPIAPAPREVAPVTIPAPASPPDGNFPVTFESLDGDRVDVALDPNNGGVVTVGTDRVANLFANLCTTPCTTRLPPGRHYLRFKDPDAGAEQRKYFMVEGPSTITMQKKSRTDLRAGLVLGGIVLSSVGIGAVVTQDSGEWAQGILGGVSGVVGIAMITLGAIMHDGFTTDQLTN